MPAMTSAARAHVLTCLHQRLWRPAWRCARLGGASRLALQSLGISWDSLVGVRWLWLRHERRSRRVLRSAASARVLLCGAVHCAGPGVWPLHSAQVLGQPSTLLKMHSIPWARPASRSCLCRRAQPRQQLPENSLQKSVCCQRQHQFSGAGALGRNSGLRLPAAPLASDPVLRHVVLCWTLTAAAASELGLAHHERRACSPGSACACGLAVSPLLTAPRAAATRPRCSQAHLFAAPQETPRCGPGGGGQAGQQ